MDGSIAEEDEEPEEDEFIGMQADQAGLRS